MRDRILREVPEKRERFVKHFQMTQKGMAAAVYPAPVHYEEDGPVSYTHLTLPTKA